MNVLGDLLRIKIFREKKAERALTAARHRLQSAEQELSTAKLILKEHRSESERREKELYADLCKRLVFIRDIDGVHIDVQLMKEREAELLEEVEQAEIRRDEMAVQAEEARADHAFAVRMREKFDELMLRAKEEQDFEAMRIEELEIEESAEVRFSGSMAEDRVAHKSAGKKMKRKRSPTDLGPIYLDIQYSRCEEIGDSGIVNPRDVIHFQRLLQSDKFDEKGQSIRSIEGYIFKEESKGNLNELLKTLCEFAGDVSGKNNVTAKFLIDLDFRGNIDVVLASADGKMFYDLMAENQETQTRLDKVKEQLSCELSVRLQTTALVRTAGGNADHSQSTQQFVQVSSVPETR